MNKSVLKTFATNARRELLKKVKARAMKLGITEDNIKKTDIESSDAIFIDGRQLSKEEKTQRDRLIDRINQIGFKQVMEEVAYTWFNRFTALRFMEVNDYLPTKVRVLSSTNAGSAEPDAMKEALSLDLDLNKEYIYELKMNNNSEELFKYLIIKHCNDLNRYMPFMFETIDDYTEILFPEGLLVTDSFLRYMTNAEVIPEDNWKEIEVIGWLYQYYIAEEKDQVFEKLKKNIKITKDTLPAATQLFTPNWIVRYMVENSLGRVWIESNPTSHLKSEWKYYLDEAEQEETVINQLEEIRYKNVNPEEITFLDPCCGSGHILVYAFDIFYEMYLEKGYVENEIPQLILEKNLFGLDVDDRAAQLASFAVMMKAREKSRRIFRKAILPNVYAIEESNWLTDEMIGKISEEDNEANMFATIRDSFLDAKEYGSLINVSPINYGLLKHRLQRYKEKQADLIEMIDKQKIEERLPNLLKVSEVLSNRYDIVCTNPPYMAVRNASSKLKTFIFENYSISKTDMFSVFIQKALEMCSEKGYVAMITQQSWMFLSFYEKFREKILENNSLVNLLHLGTKAFQEIGGEVVSVASFVLRKSSDMNYRGKYIDVTDYTALEKQQQFFNESHLYNIKQRTFTDLPGQQLAYWISEDVRKTFNSGTPLGEITKPRQGVKTLDNDRFLKLWFEVEENKIGFKINSISESVQSKYKWFPYNKGGTFRRWYGNNEYVVNWENDGKEMKEFAIEKYNSVTRTITNISFFFREGCTWSDLTTGKFGARYVETGYIFDSTGPTLYLDNPKHLNYILGLINSTVFQMYLDFLCQGLHYSNGVISKVPVFLINDEKLMSQINSLVISNINNARIEWDSFETSWGFDLHPLIKHRENSNKIETAFKNWSLHTELLFKQIKNNEEELNSIFINIYNLQHELAPKVEDKDLAIRKSDLETDIKSFISFAIGCSFGRYSLDEKGLIFAGGDFEHTRYKTFPADQDNILPILSGAYFEDDIVSRFIDFVRISFGEETLIENLDFVAGALGRKNGEAAKETLRRYFLNDFYKDHLKTYSKRPIYWMFTSGKEKAFNCLIYMHRYDKTTLSSIRTDYLHDYQIRIDAEKKDLLNIIDGDSTAKEISNAKKELKSLDKKIEELKAYDELLHHMADMQIEIDLDDGVKVNYEKFKGLVAKI